MQRQNERNRPSKPEGSATPPPANQLKFETEDSAVRPGALRESSIPTLRPHRPLGPTRAVPLAASYGRIAPLVVGLLAPTVLSGCDPLIEIAGAYFPCWLFCSLVGLAAPVFLRPLFVAFRLEVYLWLSALVYSSLALLVACTTYIGFFR